MKKFNRSVVLAIIVVLFLATGCQNTSDKSNNSEKNNKSNVINEEVNNEDNKNAENKQTDDIEKTEETSISQTELGEDEDVVEAIEYSKGDFTGERSTTFDKSEDGKTLNNFKTTLLKEDFSFYKTVTNYEYEDNGKKYKGDINIVQTGGTEGSYYGTYEGVLEEV